MAIQKSLHWPVENPDLNPTGFLLGIMSKTPEKHQFTNHAILLILICYDLLVQFLPFEI